MPTVFFLPYRRASAAPPPPIPPPPAFTHGRPQTAAEGTNTYGRANSVYPVLSTYEEGGVIEMKMIISTYHWVSGSTFFCLKSYNTVDHTRYEVYDSF